MALLPHAPIRLLLALALAATLAGCSESGSAKGAEAGTRERPARSIDTEPVRREAVNRTVNVSGTLAAENQVTVSSQAEGVVSRILADLGDRVVSGQVLVELDREKLQYNLDQQKAALARSLARYGANEPGRLPPIDQTPDVKRAAAELNQARRGFERATELSKRQLLSQQALDDADAVLRTKQAEYDSAMQNVKNMAADIDASNAAARLAERQLRDANIRAPFDGYVQQRMVSLGELVKEQMPVMQIVRIDPLKVTAEIPEGLAPWVKGGQAVDLQVDAYPDQSFTGKVSRISPSVNQQTRAFPFEALVPNPQGLLKPGTFVRVKLTTNHVEQLLTLPYAALQYRYGVNRAFVVTGDSITGREVKVGDRLGDRIEILGGVQAGDVVALTDVDNLSDGMKVAPKQKAN
jgi:multidrug efflux pump subunit AcrA (membrane-fusion protein)